MNGYSAVWKLTSISKEPKVILALNASAISCRQSCDHRIGTWGLEKNQSTKAIVMGLERKGTSVSTISIALAWSLMLTYMLSLTEWKDKIFYNLRVVGKRACWFSGHVIDTPHWVVFGEENRPGLYRMSDLKSVFQFPERILSLHTLNMPAGEKLLVGYEDRWTVLAVPTLEEEWTVFHPRMDGKIVMNQEWLVEIRPNSPTVIGRDLSLNVIAWRWSTLSENNRKQLPEPDVSRTCKLTNLSSSCTISFANESAAITFDNEDQIAVVHLASEGVEYRHDSKYYATGSEGLFARYSTIESGHATNLRRQPWFITSSGQVILNKDSNGSISKPYTRISFENALFLFELPREIVVTVRTGQLLPPTPIHLWYSIFSPICFWAAFSFFTACFLKRIKWLSKLRSLWLGIWSVASYLTIVVYLEPLFINLGGFWKYPNAVWLLPVWLMTILFAMKIGFFRETLKHIVATSAILTICLFVVSISLTFVAMPALSQWGKTMLPIAISIVYYELTSKHRRADDPSPSRVSSRWSVLSNWLHNITLALQVLLGIILIVFWTIAATSSSGSLGTGILLLVTSVIAKYVAVATTIPWLLAWLLQCWLADFSRLKTLVTFFSVVPVIVSLHLV